MTEPVTRALRAVAGVRPKAGRCYNPPRNLSPVTGFGERVFYFYGVLMSLAVLLKLVQAVPRYGRLVYCLYRDPRTPRTWKVGLGLSVAAILSPFINVPEIVPVLGEMETVALLIVAVSASMRFVPEYLITEHEAAIVAGTSYFHQDMHKAVQQAMEKRHRAG